MKVISFMMSQSKFKVRVACFIFNKKKELLLVTNKRGTWGIVGGHVEFNEQPENAAHREVMEEMSIKIKLVKLIDLSTNGDSFTICYAAKHILRKVVLGHEKVNCEFAWVSLKDLNKYNLTFKELPKLAKKAKVFV